MDGWRPDFAGDGWAHGGVASIPGGAVVVTDPGGSQLLVLSSAGRLEQRIPTDAYQAHGLALAAIADRPAIWISDTGFRVGVRGSTAEKIPGGRGQVFAVGPSDGARIMELDPPDHPSYRQAEYCPTSTAVDGGAGEVWVADGYGASLVHRYTAYGRYLASLDGETGAGRFDCPHSVFIDRRGAEPRLYVSDRGNRRVQVFDLDGGFVRSFGEDVLTSPSGFAVIGNRHVIPELRARMVVVDEDDAFEFAIGSEEVAERPGWPNRLDEDGDLVPPDPVPAGVLNSPHAIASDDAGHVYVTEFFLGGRLTRFASTDLDA